jgi:flagellum-specific ATP synthase
MPKVTTKEHQIAARKFKMLYSRYMRGRELLSMGAYVPGGDAELDMAVRMWPQIQRYLQQDAEEAHSMENALAELMKIASAIGGPGQAPAGTK